MFEHIRSSLARATWAFTRRGDNASAAPPSWLPSAANADLVRAATIIEVVEASPLLRKIDAVANEEGRPQIEHIQIRAAGVIGFVKVPSTPETNVKRDLLGSPVTVVGSDGTRFQGCCWNVSGYDAGVALGFVFTPSPADDVLSITVTVEPFAQPASWSPVVLHAALA